MVRLESIVAGVRLAGVIGDQSGEVVATRAYGPNPVKVGAGSKPGRLTIGHPGTGQTGKGSRRNTAQKHVPEAGANPPCKAGESGD